MKTEASLRASNLKSPLLSLNFSVCRSSDSPTDILSIYLWAQEMKGGQECPHLGRQGQFLALTFLPSLLEDVIIFPFSKKRFHFLLDAQQYYFPAFLHLGEVM